MNTRFVSIGEAMVELAPASEPGLYGVGFAGDTLNTAWYARKILPPDWQVDYLTAVGQDAMSARMLDFLAQAGIGTEYIQRRADKTVGLYMIELQDGERSFSYWRSDSAARLICEDLETLGQAIASAGMVYFSGISIAILPEDHRGRLMAALALARTNGAKIVFDPNLRPKLWPDQMTMCAAIMAAAQVSDIVLPSHEDEATYFGDADLAATAARYAKAGASLVVVKNGGGEMLSLDKGETALHQPQSVTDIVDTTAAGDSFNAGFLAAYLQGAGLGNAISQGAALAAKVIGQRGALVTL
ncbi:MAG: sugar kinase [Mangrovicoccus sp.]